LVPLLRSKRTSFKVGVEAGYFGGRGDGLDDLAGGEIDGDEFGAVGDGMPRITNNCV
jgi:hypothetical protein